MISTDIFNSLALRRIKQYGRYWYVRPNSLDSAFVKHHGYHKGYWYLEERDDSDIWLDAGAHIGVFSGQIAGGVGKVYAFEPQSENFAILEANMKNISNVEVFNEGITAEESGRRRLYVMDSSVAHTTQTVSDNYEMPTFRNIDEVIQSLNINKVKLDIEGDEIEILRHSMMLLEMDEIAAEVHPQFIGNVDQFIDEIFARFSSYGFQCDICEPYDKGPDILIHMVSLV